MEVKCPRCGEPAKFSADNPFRPFCSERCKLIDLGAWAEGKYSIPVVDTSDIEEETDSEPSSDEGSDPSAAPVH